MHTGPLGRRIAVFGGGGKTTLASAISRKLDVPHIELDAIRHMPDWVERPDYTEGWVADGNYQLVRPLILARADTVVVIQMWFPVMFWRILKRSISRVKSGEPLWNGNRETWRMTFASRESILLEIIGKRKRYASYGKTIARDVPPGADFLLVRGVRQLDEFYRKHSLKLPENSH